MVEQEVPHVVTDRRVDVGVGGHLPPGGVGEDRHEADRSARLVEGDAGAVDEVGLGRGEHPGDVGAGGVGVVDDGRLAGMRHCVEGVEVSREVHGPKGGGHRPSIPAPDHAVHRISPGHRGRRPGQPSRRCQVSTAASCVIPAAA